MYESPSFLPAGDQSLVVELGDSIDAATNRRVQGLTRAVESSGIAGILDLIPSYRSLLVNYDPLEITASELRGHVEKLEKKLKDRSLRPERVVRIPTLYGGEHGPDIDFVADHSGLSVQEVVALHSGRDYPVYMLGFSPGFPYLGDMSEKLATPRLETPRTVTPAGSVGIAESQTGIYPLASPGGWRLIGRTPVRMFDAEREPPSALRPGDLVRFEPLESVEQFEEIEGLSAEGRYEVLTERPS